MTNVYETVFENTIIKAADQLEAEIQSLTNCTEDVDRAFGAYRAAVEEAAAARIEAHSDIYANGTEDANLYQTSANIAARRNGLY